MGEWDFGRMVFWEKEILEKCDFGRMGFWEKWIWGKGDSEKGDF